MAVWRRLIVVASGALMVGGFAGLPMSPAAAAGPSGGCGATAQISSQWGTGSSGGQILTVTVTNTSSVTSTKWTVTWNLAAGQQVVAAWNTTLSTSNNNTTNSAVSASNVPFNGTLAPVASTSFGVQLAGIAPAPALTCASDAAATVTLTQADSRTTVTVHLGQTLAVELGADFRPITLTGSALVQVSTSGGYPTGQPLLATYRAVALGTADLNTITDYACLHTVPACARPQLLWTVHVVVVG